MFRGKTSDLRSYGDARQLADWLNQNAPSLQGPQRRVGRLIELLRQASRASGLSPDQTTEIESLLLPAAGRPWKPVPRMGGTGWYVSQTWPMELHGLVLAARLSDHGLEWIRRCPCGTWFVAHNGRSQFHTEKCRVAFWMNFHKTPEGRAQRAAYMRQLRAAKKRIQVGRAKRQKKEN